MIVTSVGLGLGIHHHRLRLLLRLFFVVLEYGFLRWSLPLNWRLVSLLWRLDPVGRALSPQLDLTLCLRLLRLFLLSLLLVFLELDLEGFVHGGQLLNQILSLHVVFTRRRVTTTGGVSLGSPQEIWITVQISQDQVLKIGHRLLIFFELLASFFGLFSSLLCPFLLGEHGGKEGDLVEFGWNENVAVDEK